MKSVANRLLIALLLAVAFRPQAANAQGLKARLDGEQLHVVAANLNFLSMEARQRLHDGASVTYAFRLNVSATRNGAPLSSIFYHCVFSYDIWEEKYKVVRTEPGYRSASHLAENAAQDLCIESLTIPAASLNSGNPFWISLEYRMEDPQSSGSRDDSKSILETMLDVFSQRKGKPQSTGTLQGGPFRIADLRKAR